MKLIDRENYCQNLCRCLGLADGCEKSKCPLWQAPTVDALPVVRCRDCKFFNTDVDPWCLLVGGLLVPSPEAFCSLGERKEVSGS